MKHTTEIEIKKWQSRLASAIEDKETAEKKLRELGVATAVKAIRPGKIESVNLTVPNWYSKDEMYWYLIRENYSKEIATELAQRWADDLQGAFKKGFEKGVQRSSGENIDAVFQPAPAAPDMNERNGIIEMEQKLQNHPALSKSAQSSPTEHGKGVILGWRLCYESIFNKEELAMPAPDVQEPEVVPPGKRLTKEQIDTLNDIDREYKERMRDYFAGY